MQFTASAIVGYSIGVLLADLGRHCTGVIALEGVIALLAPALQLMPQLTYLSLAGACLQQRVGTVPGAV